MKINFNDFKKYLLEYCKKLLGAGGSEDEGAGGGRKG